MNWLPISVLVGAVITVSMPVCAGGENSAYKGAEPCGFNGSAATAAAKSICVPVYPSPAVEGVPASWGEGIPNASPTGGVSLHSPRYAKAFVSGGYAEAEVKGALPPPSGKVFDQGARKGNYLVLPYANIYWPTRQNSQLDVVGGYDPTNPKDQLGHDMSSGNESGQYAPETVAGSNQISDTDPKFLALTKLLTDQVAEVNSRGNGISVGDEIIVDDQGGDVEFMPTPSAWSDSLDTPASYRGSSKIAKLSDEEECEAVFYATIPETGLYDIQMWWVPGPAKYRSANVPVVLHTDVMDIDKVVDQTNPSLSKQWNSLGRVLLSKGDRKKIATISTKGMTPSPTEAVSVDAVRIVKVQD